MEEQFDVLDCTGALTGDRIGRDEAHATGTWHGAFHCLLFFRRAGRTAALFQLRSREKKIAPSRFDVTVGGHYAAGETAPIAGPREIREEIGLVVRFEQLVPVGRRTFVYCFNPGVKELEFQDVFLLPFEGPPEGIVLQEGEVDAMLELEVEQGIALFGGRAASVPGLLRSRTGDTAWRDVTAAEFVPCLDQHYLKLLLLARRYAGGERDLLAI
jgi:isopentenyldiphosphate isomerase